MEKNINPFGRRKFIRSTAAITTGLLGLNGLQTLEAHHVPASDELFVIGPMDGFSPQIGTLVSMLNYNRHTIINAVKWLTKDELDYLHDPKANTIGALIMHLGATDKFYQINSFEGRQAFNEAEKKMWLVPMSLGPEVREKIKGHKVNYYLDLINEVREKTIEELKKKDDKWLMAVDPLWSKDRPINTFWKWFHVCEHESNHRGQITWLKSRLPGAKASND